MSSQKPKPQQQQKPSTPEPPAENPGAQSFPEKGEAQPNPDDPQFKMGYDLGFEACEAEAEHSIQLLREQVDDLRQQIEQRTGAFERLKDEYEALDRRHADLLRELEEEDEIQHRRPGATPEGGVEIPCRDGGTLTVPERAAAELKRWLGPKRGVDAAAMYDGYFNVVSYPDGQAKTFRL